MFEGSCVAIVTPMNASGQVDSLALTNLVQWHLEEGTQAIVVAGSTGEGATLSPQEQYDALTLVCELVKKRIPVIAATGTNVTTTTIERTQKAKALGADACLVVTPYYNRPTQNGLIAHYTALTNAVDIPIVLYNVPSRTGCDLKPETVIKLSKIPSIVGIKEATGDLSRVKPMLEQCGSDFYLYSGDDPSALEFIKLGGKGVISITSNVAPKLMQQMCLAALHNENETATVIDQKLSSLHRMLCCESNPIPVKWALNQMGKMHPEIRLPLTPLSSDYHAPMKEALNAAGIGI